MKKMFCSGGVGEPAGERHREHALAQAHRALREYRRVHEARRAVDHRPEVHLREDVALDVDAGRDLDQLQALVAQAEHAALGDVEHGLPPLPGVRCPETCGARPRGTNFLALPSCTIASLPSATRDHEAARR